MESAWPSVGQPLRSPWKVASGGTRGSTLHLTRHTRQPKPLPTAAKILDESIERRAVAGGHDRVDPAKDLGPKAHSRGVESRRPSRRMDEVVAEIVPNTQPIRLERQFS
jgi:hypothetical protein